MSVKLSSALLMGALLLGLFANFGQILLFDEDEGSFAQASLEMVKTGDWIRISLDDEPHHHKPILIYWLQALSIELFGANEWAVRLPSILAATAWLIAVIHFLLWTIKQRELALMGGLLLATTWGFVLIGRAATADSVLNLFLCLSLFAIYRCFTNSDAWRWPVFLWMGLGVLTKGPIAIVIPFIVSGVLWMTAYRGRDWLRQLINLPGWLIFLTVLTPWAMAIYAQLGYGFFYDFILTHNLQRFATPLQGHQGSVFYYFGVLPLILLPFSGLLIALPFKQLWGDTLSRFCIIWFLTVFILFTAAQTKLPHYLIYGLTPLVILLIRHTGHLYNRWLALPALLGFGLFLALPIYAHWKLSRPLRIHEQEILVRVTEIADFSSFGVIVLILLGLSVGILWVGRCTVFKRLALIGLMQNAFISFVLLPHYAEIQQRPIFEAGKIAKTRPTVTYRTVLPSFSFYRRQPTPRRLPREGEWVFLRADKVAALEQALPQAHWRIHYAQGGIRLLEWLPTSEVNAE